MPPISQKDMLEATRLTRSGRLAEATQLLKGAFSPTTAEAGATPAAAGAKVKKFAEKLGRVPGLSRAPASSPTLPPGATFDEHVYAGGADRRSYKLYIPAARGPGLRPLVVMLHGCTQSPDDFAAGTRMNQLAEDHGFLVAYPAQSQSANSSKCWNWFKPSDQGRGRGEPALIEGITRQVMSEHDVDPSRIFVAGLSAGGAAAAIMGAAYPDLYAGVGIHSGLACGAAHDMPSAFAAMQRGAARPDSLSQTAAGAVRAIVFHGDQDHTVHAANGDQVFAQFSDAGDIQVEEGRTPGGRSFTRSVRLDENGKSAFEQWVVHGAGHAWSGGSSGGSFTDPSGPDASREMIRFFLNP